jgi:hypothetical protein
VAQVRLGGIDLCPQRGGIGDQVQRRSGRLVGTQFHPRIDIALDHQAVDRAAQRKTLVHAVTAGSAVHAQRCLRALLVSRGARVVRLGLLQILLGDDPGLVQLALARQRLRRHRAIRGRLAGIGLGQPKSGDVSIASGWPAFTVAPGCTRISITRPANGEATRTVLSSFQTRRPGMLSMRSPPLLTGWPTTPGSDLTLAGYSMT